MRKIEGFHTLWTAPYFKQNTEDTYSMQDYELLTMILSALMWRKMNGPITLYGDERAIDYVERQGIAVIIPLNWCKVTYEQQLFLRC